MKNLRKKMNKKGFTLAEMLIVVAIIAVLVAVSIPVFTSKLEKAREATDIANMRAAKAAAVAAYLNEDSLIMTDDGSGVITSQTFYYDAVSGTIVDDAPDKAYGQGTSIDGGIVYEGYNNDDTMTDQVITVQFAADGKVTIDWAVPSNNSGN